jgi:hypothetical protein
MNSEGAKSLTDKLKEENSSVWKLLAQAMANEVGQ